MNKLVNINTKKKLGVLASIEQAKQLKLLSSSLAIQKKQEYKELIIELAFLYNHKRSTLITKKQFQKIIRTIDYIFIHGMSNYAYELRVLNEYSIATLFAVGQDVIKQDVNVITVLLEDLKTKSLYFNNERYQNVIHKQVINYLESLKQYRGIFNYDHINEDLDYPLIDGLALYHNMYNLKGSDLVLYYLQRMKIENAFCAYFEEEIPVFIAQFEQQRGISISLIGMNLCEELFYQYSANLLLSHTHKILLEEVEFIRLKAYLLHHEIQILVAALFVEMQAFISDEIIAYLQLFQEQLLTRLQQIKKDNFDGLIYQRERDNQVSIKINQDVNDILFNTLIDQLKSTTDKLERIKIIKNKNINIYDLIDLFNSEILNAEEYLLYYRGLAMNELAILLKILTPECNLFAQKVVINKEFIDSMEQDEIWQQVLVQYLDTLTQQQKHEIGNWLSKIVLS